MIDPLARGILELTYFVLGGAGLFILALASLLAATAKRGVPQLRGGTRHRHVGPLSAEECPSTFSDPMDCMWEGIVEVTNVGADFLVIQHGGLVLPRDFDGGGLYDAESTFWTVNGETHEGPFTLAPGQIAVKGFRTHPDRKAHTGRMQVNLLVRRWWRRILEDAYMEIGAEGSTARVKFGTR